MRCVEEGELLRRYHATVEASGGAPVVYGAEFSLWPWYIANERYSGLYGALRGRGSAVLRAFADATGGALFAVGKRSRVTVWASLAHSALAR